MERCFHCMRSTKEKGEGTIVPPFHHTDIKMSVVTLWEGVKNKCSLSVCLSFSLLLSSIFSCPVNYRKTQRITVCAILCGKIIQLPNFRVRRTFSYLESTLLTSILKFVSKAKFHNLFNYLRRKYNDSSQLILLLSHYIL